VRGTGRDDPTLIKHWQECHLLAALVKLTLGPALHGPGPGHRVRSSLYAELERRSAVGPGGQPGRWTCQDVGVLVGQRSTAAKSGGSPVSGGRVNAGPAAAKVTLANQELSAVRKGVAHLSETCERVLRPRRRRRRRECSDRGRMAAARRRPERGTAQKRDLEARIPEQRRGVSRRQAQRRGRQGSRNEVQAEAATRRAAPLGA
jgi:hypothetical protein